MLCFRLFPCTNALLGYPVNAHLTRDAIVVEVFFFKFYRCIIRP